MKGRAALGLTAKQGRVESNNEEGFARGGRPLFDDRDSGHNSFWLFSARTIAVFDVVYVAK